MKLQKKIKRHFDAVSVPDAHKVLPREAFERKRTARSFRKLVPIALCLTLAAVLVFSMLPVADTQEQSSYPYTSTESAVLESDVTSDAESVPVDIEFPLYSQEESIPSSDVIIVDREPIYGAEKAGECIADMYRPEGYHERIGSALALMMELTPEKDARFDVLVSIRIEYDLDGDDTFNAEMQEIVSQINETLDDKIGMMLDRAEVTGGANIAKYYFSLTAEQINAFAEYGRCLYIGSGVGDPKDINWETAEGIKTYCEIWGDMYTFGNTPGYSILEHPESGPVQGGGPEELERYYPDNLYGTAPLFEIVGEEAVVSFFEKLNQEKDAAEIEQLPSLYWAVHGLGIAKEELLAAVGEDDYTAEQIELIYTGTEQEIQKKLKTSWAFWYDGRLYNIYDLVQLEQEPLRELFRHGDLSTFLHHLIPVVEGRTHFEEWIDTLLSQAR